MPRAEGAIADFKKNFPAALAEVRQGLPPGTPVELWWQEFAMEAAIGPRPMADARVGQKTGITRRWAKRGTRPAAPKDQRTTSAYIFGAICPAQGKVAGKAAGLVMPQCNTEAMAAHLAEISRHVA